MSDTVDSATIARLWIADNVALFVVIVIAAVLLIVALLTLLFYCCCCRVKRDHWHSNRERLDSKSSGSHLQIQVHGDTMDADSVATATVRGPRAIEIHVETEHKQHHEQDEHLAPDYPEYDAPYQLEVSVSKPEIVISHEDHGVSLEQVRIQQMIQQEPEPQQAEFPPLPPLPQGVEVTADAELRFHSSPSPEFEAETKMEATRPILRLPRTEVILRTESPSWQVQQQHQQLQRASPPALRSKPPAGAVVVTAAAAAPIVRISSGRATHEHRHGSSIYQSDDNEITIVDSDFSDYEDSPEDEARKRRKKVGAAALRFGVGINVGAEAAAASDADFLWETLPNHVVRPAGSAAAQEEEAEELPVVAVDRSGQEYVPAPSPSLEAQWMRRTENLAHLDKTLDVFQQQVEADASVQVGVNFGVGGSSSQVELNMDGHVEEDEIQPIDRSQVVR